LTGSLPLADHLMTMGEFIVNARPRDEEICALVWAWEIPIPELDPPELKRTVFIIPEQVTRCFTDDPHPGLLVLNDAAQKIVDAQRGLHPRYVFTYKDVRGNRDRLDHMLNSGWKAARRRAAVRYRKEFGREAPMGSGESGSTIYGTRLGDACAQRVSDSRTDRLCSGTSRAA
jgi:hypothetical protein